MIWASIFYFKNVQILFLKYFQYMVAVFCFVLRIKAILCKLWHKRGTTILFTVEKSKQFYILSLIVNDLVY